MTMQIAAAGNYAVVGHESITVSSTPIGVTQSIAFPGGVGVGDCYYMYATVETNPIRVWFDNSGAPTSSLGHLLAAGAVLEVFGNVNIQNLRFIRQSADATVMASYGR